MSRSITTVGEVKEDHTLTVSVPDMPPGPVTVTIMSSNPGDGTINTLGELLASDLLGDWADRADLPSNNEEFVEWRRRLWERKAS